MRIEEAYQRFQNCRLKPTEDFCGLDLGTYRDQVLTASMAGGKCWILPRELRPELLECMGAVKRILARHDYAGPPQSTVHGVLQTISTCSLETKGRVPLYAVLDFTAAWSTRRGREKNPDMHMVNRFYTIGFPDRQQRFMRALEEVTRKLGDSVERNKLKQALAALDEIEHNILVMPWAFNVTQRKQIIDILAQCRQYEKALMRRAVARVMRMTVPKLLDSHGQMKPATAQSVDRGTAELARVIVERGWLEGSALDDHFRLQRAVCTLRALARQHKMGNPEVFEDEIANHFLIERGLANSIRLSRVMESTEVFLNVHCNVAPLFNLAGQESPKLEQNLLLTRLSHELYKDNVFHAKTLSHLFFGHVIASAKLYDVEHTVPAFETGARRLDAVLRAYRHCTLEFALGLWLALKQIGSDPDTLKFGHVYHLSRIIGDDVSPRDVHLVAERMRTLEFCSYACTNDWVSIASPIHSLFEDSAQRLRSAMHNDLAYGYFVNYGLIVPPGSEQTKPTATALASRSGTAVVATEAPDDEHRVQETVMESLKHRRWLGVFSKDYAEFRDYAKPHRFLENLISDRTRQLLGLIDGGRLDEKSISKHLLEDQWPQIMRDVVLLRLILVLWKLGMTLPKLAILMGYVPAGGKGSGSLGHHLKRLGLSVKGALRKWLTSKAIPEAERAWVRQEKRLRGDYMPE